MRRTEQRAADRRRAKKQRGQKDNSQDSGFSKRWLPAIIFFVLLILALIFVSGWWREQQRFQATEFTPEYYQQLLNQSFLDEHPNETVDLLLDARYTLSIQGRERANHWVPDYPDEFSEDGVLLSIEAERSGTIYHYTPKFYSLNIRDLFQRSEAYLGGSNREKFENSVVVATFHAYDTFIIEKDNPAYRMPEDHLEIKRLAWAQTAASIREVKKSSNFPLLEHDEAIYQAWINSGQNSEHPEWRRYITSLYNS